MKIFYKDTIMVALFMVCCGKLWAANDNNQVYTSITVDATCYLNCTSEVRTSWAQIEEKVLSHIGSMGYTKGQFEADYELETYEGTLGSSAVQFEKTYVDGTMSYTQVELSDTIGIFRYTTSDLQGRQTNVLEWSFGRIEGIVKAITGKDDYAEAREALIMNKGQGLAGKTLTGTIRFVRKNLTDKDHAAIYVDIVIPAQNIFVAYGQVTGKFISSFYELNTNNMSATEATARELHVSTPVPFITGGQNLSGVELHDNMRQYFRKNMVSYDDSHFSNFTADDIRMRFTLPSKANGNASFDAEADGTWTVYGFSGHEYQLAINAQADAICIVGRDGDVEYDTPLPLVCIEDGTDIVWKNGVEACDILNFAGQNSNIDGGSALNAFMGSKQSFAAYIEIYSEACYEMLLEDRFFNVRFVRPIDMFAHTEYTWARLFDPYTFILHDLVTLKDCRDTEIVWQQQFRDEPDYKHTGHDFYGISRLYTTIEEFRSDYNLPDNERVLTTDTARINRMDKIADIEQLNGYVTLENIPAETDEEQKTDLPEEYRIIYQNKGGEARLFHIYVPITVDYAWGSSEGIDGAIATQRSWAVLEIEATAVPTGLDGAPCMSKEETTDRVPVYNLEGKRMSNTMSPNIFIIKGKKYIHQ